VNHICLEWAYHHEVLCTGSRYGTQSHHTALRGKLASYTNSPQPGSQPDLREKPRRPVTFTLVVTNLLLAHFQSKDKDMPAFTPES
jgi:hypothetical protein